MLKRRAGYAADGIKDILRALRALDDNPTDEKALQLVAKLAFEDSATFVRVVLGAYVVPEVFIPRAASSHTCGFRQAWSNYVGTQEAQPYAIACPTTLSELQGVVRTATANTIPIRAVGSHHAWSDAALCDGVIIETSRLRDDEALADVDRSVLRPGVEADYLIQLPGGMTIGEINDVLDTLGRSLINMGGYDGQTLAGVISTSTHGAGISLGSFPSFVQALIVVDANGNVLQIEPDNGITDPALFTPKYTATKLIQDSAVFNAAVVGIGSIGIIYAVILRVRDKHFLHELRTLDTWENLRDQLRQGDIIRNYLHFEVWVNPLAVNGTHTCLVTKRQEVAPPTHTPFPPKPFRDLFAEFLASIPGADKVLAWLFNTFPALAPWLNENALTSLEDTDGYTDVSFRMLNIGAANSYAAICSELGVDLEKHVDAVDSMLELAAQAQAENTFHGGTIPLRYVAKSPGFLSMQPRETCMIELPMLRDVFGSDALLWRYENLLTSRFCARPHWGQRNFLTGSHQMLEQMYGSANVQAWLEVFASFSPRGQFFSRFTDRVGFSSHACATSSKSK